MPQRQDPVWHSSPGKAESKYNQGEKSVTHSGGTKNVILCFLANMGYIRDIICTGYTIHKKADIHQISVPQEKKETNKKLINQSACMNAEIERGRGEVIFTSTKIKV